MLSMSIIARADHSLYALIPRLTYS